MTLMKGSEPWMQNAVAEAQRKVQENEHAPNARLGMAARSELALRNGMEDLMRSRLPDARLCHEMVMGEGRVRADLVAIDETHIAAIEVKGGGDDTSRLIHQIAMFQLCVPEVWMVVDRKHSHDATLVRHLLPCVGLIVGDGLTHLSYDWDATERPVTFEVEAEPVPRAPVPEMTLQMLWAAELKIVCARLNIGTGSKSTRASNIKDILRLASADEIMRETCTALRARDALWRADTPIPLPPRAKPTEVKNG